MFPKVHVITSDSTVELADDTWEYALPAAVAEGRLLTVECETGDGDGRWDPLWAYKLRPSVTAPSIMLTGSSLPAEEGSKLRFTVVNRLTPFVLQPVLTETFTGPDGTEELPVMYAMGLAVARLLNGRTEYKRYSTTQAANGVTAETLMTMSQFWFAQFELLLDRWEEPAPHMAS